MTQAAAFDPGAFQGFLTYGPLGLAGLLLVLVVTALTLRKVDEATERVLKLVLFVGAFCFVAALVAQVIAIPPGDYSKQRAALKSAETGLNNAKPLLQEITSMASAEGCPGGAHGIAIPHGADMASRSSSVLATIQGAASNIKDVIESLH
jgi:hypothetical protein